MRSISGLSKREIIFGANPRSARDLICPEMNVSDNFGKYVVSQTGDTLLLFSADTDPISPSDRTPKELGSDHQ
jgi:hypothetical protein